MLDVLRRAKTRIGTARELAREHGYPMHTRDMDRGLDEIDAAISSEEARRARPAGSCSTCCGPVHHRDGKPGEYDHECRPAVAEPKFEVQFTSPVEEVVRNAGRALYHAVETLDAMLGDGEPRTAAQRAEAYRQVYLAQERWLAFDPEAQTAPVAPAVEDPRDATIRDLRALLGRCATALDLLVVQECAACHGTGKPQEWPLNVCGGCFGEGRTLWARQGGATSVDATVAALRSAGVEPTPTQTSIVKGDLGPEDWGDPREEKWPR